MKRINIGTCNQLNVYLNLMSSNEANSHVLITGKSGYGKSYLLQKMILGSYYNSMPVVILDYSGSYSLDKLDPLLIDTIGTDLSYINAYENGINLNPFKRHANDNLSCERITDTATRLVNILDDIYHLGSRQRGLLYECIFKMLDNKATVTDFETDPNKYFKTVTFSNETPILDFALLRYYLEEINSDVSASIICKLNQLVDSKAFRSESTSSKNCTSISNKVLIYQLNHFSDEMKRIISEFILWDIWNSAHKLHCNAAQPLNIILDECQLLRQSTDAPFSKFLTEGRKFGLNIWCGTQFLNGIFKSEEINRLMQSNTQIYFRPTANDLSYIAKVIGTGSEKYWKEILFGLGKGECIVSGSLSLGENKRSSIQALKVGIPTFKTEG